MSKFKKEGNKGLPAINTSALPDIVFMLLFFFMVTTKMRDREMKIRTKLPLATEVEKLEKKSRLHYIFVGPPLPELQGEYGTTPRIQLDDAFATVDDIQQYITMQNELKDEKEVPYMTTSLKADETVKMGIITDIKQELREVNALKLSYTAAKEIKD